MRVYGEKIETDWCCPTCTEPLDACVYDSDKILIQSICPCTLNLEIIVDNNYEVLEYSFTTDEGHFNGYIEGPEMYVIWQNHLPVKNLVKLDALIPFQMPPTMENINKVVVKTKTLANFT